MVSAAWDIVTFDCVKKSFEEAEIVQSKAITRNPHLMLKNLMVFWILVPLTRISFYGEDDFDTDL